MSVEEREPLLTIGVFARRSRLSLKALRLYDRLGLLTPAHVDEDTGYRRYRESQLETARLVALLRRLDMPLAQVSEVLSAPGPARAKLVEAHWEAVERRKASQRELAEHLRITLSGGQASYGFRVRERDVAEQLVLTERRRVRVDELPGWIEAAIRRLSESVQRYGGVAGSWFVVYYGEVNEDSDGPVEVCAPVEPGRKAVADRALRREPAHREAYARLRKAQVEFPQILSAYDAVAQWINSNGHTFAGAPREVYFADFASAAPGDEVCDVAFPVA
jgi:DNA-binding transcriptional MerR regulator